MNSARWVQIKDAFAAVVEMAPDERRNALAELCRDDLELRSEVERLLAQHEEMGEFLEGSSPAGGRSSAQHIFAAGEIVAGRYRIMEFLGSGGMGEVYAAEDQELGEQIAIKIIRQETPFGSNMLERLRREVQLARRVTHPNVCRVFDLGRHQQQDEDVIFLTMELIRGETLSTRLEREGKINPSEALLIATQLCEALDAAHQVGVLHRDFKTSNVMLSGEGEHLRAVITDFGIARLISGTKDSATVSMTQGVVGTPAYMSPEQLLEEQLTVASDIYSLGLVLYEMVTGNRPFQGVSSWTETLKRLSVAPRPPVEIVRDLDARWNSAILRCLQRDPAKRFASARAVANFLAGKRFTLELLRSRRFQVTAACLIAVMAVAAFVLRDRIWPIPLPQQKHVAVMPFTFQGTDQANQARAYELAESLTANLSRLEASESSLWVVPWSKIIKQTPDDAAHPSSSLGVNLVLTGELQRTGDTLHLVARLKDATSLRQIRSKTVEIAEGQIMTLEDKLLEQALSMLQFHSPPQTLHHLPVDATTEPGAYDFYEQGRGYLSQSSRTPQDLERAIGLLEKAVEKDPNFALAHANLAFAYTRKFQQTHDLQWIEKAKPLSRRALELNDGLAVSHFALGLIEQATGEQDGAIHEFEKALQLDPTDENIITQLAQAYDNAKLPLKAEGLLNDALKRAPGSWFNYESLGYFYYLHGDYPRAEHLFRQATELAPDNSRAFYDLGGIYMAEGKYKEAEDVLEKSIAIHPSAGTYSNLATIRFQQGQYQNAVPMYQKAAELSPADYRYRFNLGVALKLAGNQSKALESFRTALQMLQNDPAYRDKRDTRILSSIARCYLEIGEKKKAEETLSKVVPSSQNDPDFLFTSLLLYESRGERERALVALRSALRNGYSLTLIENDPDLPALRSDKRYTDIVRNFTH